MTDEILIHKFLERSYKVVTGDNDFVVLDLLDNSSLSSHDFVRSFHKIFGEFNSVDDETSTQIFYRWFNIKKRIIAKDLMDYFDEMDGTKGSRLHLSEAISHFKSNNVYSETFITNYFNAFYNEKFILPRVKEYVDQVNLEKGSKLMVDEFIESLKYEGIQQKDKALQYLHDWYSEKVIGGKVRDFLSQLVMTLGKRNWQVTWIGHGPFTRNMLLKHFQDESDFHHDFILRMYDDWYDGKVVESSERIMNAKSAGLEDARQKALLIMNPPTN